MIETRAAFDVLNSLYDTLDDPGQWQVWLKRTCDVLRVDGGNITLEPGHSQHETFVVANCLTEAQHQAYMLNYAAKDWQRARLNDVAIGRALAMSELSSSEIDVYLDSEFFQEFAQDTCCWMSMGGVFLREDGRMGNTGFHRRNLQKPFAQEEVQFIEMLNPHIARALQQSQNVHLLEDEVSQLGQHGCGIILLDDDGSVQYANDAASDILRNGGLTVQNHRLLTDDRLDSIRLHRAIAAIVGSRRQEPEIGEDMLISRSNHPLPLVVSVTPNHRKQPYDQAGTISAIRVVVTVRDSQRRPELRKRILRNIYGFTPRELEISELLATGLGLRSISEQLAMAYETARTHTRSMMHKAGVRGRSQLMAFLLSVSD